MTDAELKPCPFCGGNAHMRREPCVDGGGTFAYIECRSCRGRSGDTYYSRGNDCPQTYEGRREAWNTRADLPAAVTVKPLKIADQYAEKIIETEFGDYVMKENDRYSSEPTEFLGMKIQQRKYRIKLNGMLVLHTNDPDEFLSIVQADYKRRILSAINVTPASVAGWRDEILRHLDLSQNHEAGLIPMATQILLQKIADTSPGAQPVTEQPSVQEDNETLIEEIEEIISETHDIDVTDRKYAENIVDWLRLHHPTALRALKGGE